MLERVDRVQMVAEVAREEASDYLNARRTILALGASEVELCALRFGYTGTPARARGSLTKPTTEAPS
jgi:hypothetical protein